jgi:hypothetical protein
MMTDEGSPATEPLAPAAAPRVVEWLFVLRGIELGAMVLFAIGAQLASSLGVSDAAQSKIDAGYPLFWLAFTAVEIGLLFGLRRAAATARGVLGAVIALAIVSFALSGVEVVPGLRTVVYSGSLASGFLAVSVAVLAAFDVAFWIALERLRGRVDPWLRAAFFAPRLVSLAIFAFFLLEAFAPETFGKVLLEGTVATVVNWLRLAISLAWEIAVLVALRRLATSGWMVATPGDAPPAVGAGRDLVVGGAWLGGGLLVTVVSYGAASGGGRFVVATGAIVYGIVRIVRGLTRS